MSESKEIAAFREWVHNNGAEDRAFDLLREIDTLTAERDAAREEEHTQRMRALRAEQESARLREDRDRLAACVERVRELARFQNGFSGVVRATDILAALGEP
jgi:hypothetical protein